jgi:hypothetical protein
MHPRSAAETITTILTDANDYRNNCDDRDDHSDKENMAAKVKKLIKSKDNCWKVIKI